MDIKFGTDGWRGVMARDFTFDNVRRVAQAVAEYVKSDGKGPGKAVVGFDRRFQSDAFAHEISRVLEGNGVSTVLLEESLPTPALSFLTRKLKALGVMVTASHNPSAYNGIKIKLDGRAASPAVTGAIEAFIDKASPTRGSHIERKSFKKDYIGYLRSRVEPGPLFAKLGKPVIFDYMYGCAAGLMGEMVKSPRLIEMHAEHDPLFGGLHPEPIEQYLGELKKRVVAEKAVLGVALDGDADRVAIVDEKGRYLTPCQVFPMLLEYLINEKGLKGKIVQSVSMGYLAGRIASAHGLEFEELPVGFKHVGEQLALGKAVFGGEESGGYAWKGSLPERDGLVTGLTFVEMCAKTRKTPGQLWEAVEKKYGKSVFKRVDFHLSKPVADKTAWAAKIVKKLPKKILGSPIERIIDIDGVKVILQGGHWVLLRPSGTEPLLRTYAETDSAKKTQELLDSAAKWGNAHAATTAP